MGKVDWVKGSRKMGRGRDEVTDGKVGMLGLGGMLAVGDNGMLAVGDNGSDGAAASVGETGGAEIDTRYEERVDSLSILA